VQPQQDILQKLCGIELATVLVKGFVFFLNQPIQVGQNGIVLGGQPVKLGAVADAELGIQLLQHDFDGVDLPVRKVLVGSEKILEKGNVLTELTADAKGLRRILVLRATVFIPCFRFQHIDDELSGHEVNEASTEVIGQILVLHFRIEGAHIHAGFPKITQDELEKIALALTAVAENEDVGVGLVIGSLVEVHQHIAAKLIPPHIKAIAICFARIVKGIEVCHRTCWENTLELVTEHIEAAGHHALEALLLAEHQSVHVELGADQLGHDFSLQQLQLIQIVCRQLNVHSRVDEGFPVPVRLRHNGSHILQIAFGHDSLLQIIGVGLAQPVFIGGIADDFLFLHRRDMAGIDAQGHTIFFSQVAQDGLFLRGGGVLPQCPNTAVGIPADEVVGVELHH